MNSDQKPVWKTRLVKGSFPDREFDIAFWQEQGDEAIFRAAWEMALLADAGRVKELTTACDVSQSKLSQRQVEPDDLCTAMVSKLTSEAVA